MNVHFVDFRTLAEALAIGLLIGAERYRDREPGEKRSAGLRTFAVVALLGAVCGILESSSFTVMSFVSLALLLIIGYFRSSAESPGMTTEVAALLTFWLGFLMHTREALAISAGIVMVILLAAKGAMHDFVRERLSETEFFDTLKFLVVAFVVFPLLPNRYMGPFEFFNPTHVWLLVILVSSIGFLGYFLIKIFGASRGLKVGALLGALVSTSAVTMSLAERVRKNPSLARSCGSIGVMANAIQFPRLLLLVYVEDWRLGNLLSVPLLAMLGVGTLAAWVASPRRKSQGPQPAFDISLENPFSLWSALKFGFFFIVIFFVVKVATVYFGNYGVLVAGALGGLANTSAISLSVAGLAGQGGISGSVAAAAILIAAATNAISKSVLALCYGNRPLFLWLGAGFIAMLSSGAALLVIMIQL